ncbi:MAG: thioredoxin domain-containing protein [Anaerolineae bacterium]|jgi:hypothetical protein|nr:thioredoxin domain-containing protein [Anaerolineae bacterium]
MAKTPEKTPDKKAKISRTEERRQEREAQQRRQRFIIIGGSLLAVAVLVFVAVLANRIPTDAPIPDTSARYDGLTVSRSERGYARLGNLDGTVRVSAYINLASEQSKTFHETVFPGLLERVRAGEITFSYVLYGGAIRTDVSNAIGGMRAGWCANEQNQLWRYVDAAFGWVDQFGTQAFSSNRLFSGAENLGLDMGRFNECMRGGQPQEMMNRAEQDAGGRDAVVVPPAVFVNDVAVVVGEGEDLLLASSAAIDRALALRIVPTPTVEAEAEPTAEPTETEAPTAEPTEEPTVEPTEEPTLEPTVEPTEEPTAAPTAEPTATTEG